MKTTLILSVAILLAVFTGCSENTNLTGPKDQGNKTGIQQQQPGSGNSELIWKYDQLSINTDDESSLESKVAYIPNPPTMYVERYLVTFDAMSTANRWTNGYEPYVHITKNGETAFESYDTDSLNRHIEIELNYIRLSRLDFYIALFQVDGGNQIQPSSRSDGAVPLQVPCVLQLSNIKVYILY
jgi:hypothetical protein